MTYGKLEPTVINDELLTKAVFAYGPKGEAGRIAESEGIAFDSVKKLELSYKNILKIGGLKQFINLTNLHLDNNVIEKIEGLDELINLKRLDLSFNCIHRIENLDKLANLEDLSLFHNFIQKIENLDGNKKLMYLSLGYNMIENLKNMLYLRNFKTLYCLNLQNNPVVKDPEYSQFIFAFLPNLRYLDHKNILPEKRAEALEKYAIPVAKMTEEELNKKAEEIEKEEHEAYMKKCRAAFIDCLYGENLFTAMFENDANTKRYFQVPLLEELIAQFKEKLLAECEPIFQSGMLAYEARQEEEDALRQCINSAKQDAKNRSLLLIEKHELKAEVIFKMLDEIEPAEYTERAEPHLTNIRKLIHELWNDLMSIETVLVEQIEEVINEFERNLEEKVSSLIEAFQMGFTKLRNVVLTFNDKLSEMMLFYKERLSKPEGFQNEGFEIFRDRESIVNALSNTKEVHMNTVDSTEDEITKSIRTWFDELLKSLRENEVKKRHNERVTEINLYADAETACLEAHYLTLL